VTFYEVIKLLFIELFPNMVRTNPVETAPSKHAGETAEL